MKSLSRNITRVNTRSIINHNPIKSTRATTLSTNHVSGIFSSSSISFSPVERNFSSSSSSSSSSTTTNTTTTSDKSTNVSSTEKVTGTGMYGIQVLCCIYSLLKILYLNF